VQESGGLPNGGIQIDVPVLTEDAGQAVSGIVVTMSDPNTGSFGSGTTSPTGSANIKISVQGANELIRLSATDPNGIYQSVSTTFPVNNGQTVTIPLVKKIGGGTRPDINKIVAHIAASWIPELSLWSTSLQNGLITYAGITVKIHNLCWYSSEAEIYAPIMYEHGYATEAIAAKNVMLASNPWRGILRDQICYGSLLPVMKNGSGNFHQLIKTGTLSNGETFLVMNDTSTGFNNVQPSWNQNGDIAYQAINYYIRGDEPSAHHLIDIFEATWDNFGFNPGGGTYETRGLGAAGLAILVCNYDPRGIMPAVEAVAAKLQGADGSFPNSYTSALTPGIGDAESNNRIACWYSPRLLGWLQGLKGSATLTTPPNLTYVPPSYMV
jgi:hypothetical protein